MGAPEKPDLDPKHTLVAALSLSPCGRVCSLPSDMSVAFKPPFPLSSVVGRLQSPTNLPYYSLPCLCTRLPTCLPAILANDLAGP